MLNKKHAIKEINRLWKEVKYILNTNGNSYYGNELIALTKEESKRHDRFRGDSINRGITIKTESEFFAIKRLLDSVYELDNIPSLDAYHHSQKSVYLAYSLGNEFQNKIKERITIDEAKYISSLDYCQLIESD